jgi:hypothetical protein
MAYGVLLVTFDLLRVSSATIAAQLMGDCRIRLLCAALRWPAETPWAF